MSTPGGQLAWFPGSACIGDDASAIGLDCAASKASDAAASVSVACEGDAASALGLDNAAASKAVSCQGDAASVSVACEGDAARVWSASACFLDRLREGCSILAFRWERKIIDDDGDVW